jgi:transposase, IS30 family
MKTKRRTYRRLRMSERENISRYLSQKMGVRWIARKIHRSPSTVSRDIRAGGSNRWMYRADTAHRRSLKHARHRKSGKLKLLSNHRLRKAVESKLRLHWSPKQVVEWLSQTHGANPAMRVSPETIYSYLYVLPKGRLKKELLSCLRRRHKRRHVKSSKEALVRREFEDMISIEERPKAVANRTVPGHWEGDLIIGRNRQSAMGTLVERTTRATILIPLKSRKAVEVRKAFAKEALKLPRQMRLSMTYDQGREMSQHKLFTKSTRMKVYFAHPASPWERGSNENTNGLVRDFFPKGTDLSKLSRNEIKRVQHLLNGRPRQVLGFKTPYECFKKFAGVALNS